jgi:hypothetical protein
MKISCIEGKEKENVLHPLPHLWGVEHITPTYKTGFLPPPPPELFKIDQLRPKEVLDGGLLQ